MGWKLVPDGPGAARSIRWANGAVAVVAAALSAVLARAILCSFLAGWAVTAALAAVALVGWALRGRVWSVVFLGVSLLLALVAR